MPSLTVATWNVNSIRLRLEHLEALLAERPIDVLCLQELKAAPAHVPAEALAAQGFPHQAVHSMPGYNGVAILSRRPLEAVERLDWVGREDCRHVRARVAGIEVHSLYVPAGGDLPDAELNPAFRHKLDFLDAVTAWMGDAIDPDRPVLLAGDLNIAPLETDVWDHKKLKRVITHTPVEVARLEALQASGPWVDAMRHFVPAEEKLFTWWSYRSPNWQAANKGRRLDHIWVTPALKDNLRSMDVATQARGWPRPSDHAPVVVTLDVPA